MAVSSLDFTFYNIQSKLFFAMVFLWELSENSLFGFTCIFKPYFVLFCSIPVESFDLSLNGRDIIPLEDINNVADLGLVSGDLLKVITNQTDATDSNSDANLDVSLSDSSRIQRREAVQENEAAALTDSGTSGSTLVSLNQTSHGSLASTEMICDTSGNVSVNDDDGNAEGCSSHEADSLRTEPMVVRDCFEDKLPHRLRQVWDSNKPQGVTEALSLVLHVIMLETGFLTHTDAKVIILSLIYIIIYLYFHKMETQLNMLIMCSFNVTNVNQT